MERWERGGGTGGGEVGGEVGGRGGGWGRCGGEMWGERWREVERGWGEGEESGGNGELTVTIFLLTHFFLFTINTYNKYLIIKHILNQ